VATRMWWPKCMVHQERCLACNTILRVILYGGNQQIDNLNNKISALGKEANKGDARAAALAALHPMQFDLNNRVQVMGGIHFSCFL